MNLVERIKEWLVERWWDIVDLYDRSEQKIREFICAQAGHKWIEYGYSTDLEPRYRCDRCDKEERL